MEEWVLGVGAAASTMEKQGRNQNARTLEGLTPIQPNWEDLGRVVADINKLIAIRTAQIHINLLNIYDTKK